MERDQGETADNVLDYVYARGWRVSRTQLERRHQAGVIHPPRQVARGRGAGTVSIYPSGTAALLVEGLELGDVPFRRIAFELWLRGWQVPMKGVRAHLAALATLHDRVARVIRFLGFGRAALPTRVLRLVQRLAVRPGPAELQKMRTRLGNDTGRVETVVRAAIEMAAGVYAPPAPILGDADKEGPLFETVLGLEKARTDAPIGLQPWLTGELTDVLVQASRDFGGDWSLDLRGMTDAELEVGRERWRVLRGFIEVIGEMRQMYGKDLFGFGELADRYAMAKTIVDPAAVFVYARKTRQADDTEAKQFADIAAACAKWREVVSPTLPALEALRAFKPTAKLFARERLREVLTNAALKAQWEAEAAEVGRRYEREIAELLAQAGLDPKRIATSAFA